MSRTLVVKEEAARETIESYLWYETRAEGLGESFLEELDSCYFRILQNPEAFQKQYKSFRHAYLRRFPFVVVFEIEKDEIVVYSVFHTSRNPRAKYPKGN